MSSSQNVRNVTSISTSISTPVSGVAALAQALVDCVGSEDYVAVIRALVATGDRAAIHVLASLLDSVGPIAKEAMAGLLTFGAAATPAMRECVESLDYDMIRHGHRVLAALGDEASKQWLRDDARERVEVYLERLGFSDVKCGDPVANETDEAKAIA
jgi:hypothetical protein